MKNILEKLKLLNHYQQILLILLIMFMIFTDIAYLYGKLEFIIICLLSVIIVGSLLYKSYKK